MNFVDHLQRVVSTLESCGIRYVIGGSLASSAWGISRQTNDADIAVLLNSAGESCLREQLASHYNIFPSDWAELRFTKDFPAAEIASFDGAFRCDLFLLTDDDYTNSQLERARLHQFGKNFSAQLASPEDTVLIKLRWYELGNRVSDRQWNDIIQVLEIQRGKLDWNYLDYWARHFGVHELLGYAKSEQRS